MKNGCERFTSVYHIDINRIIIHKKYLRDFNRKYDEKERIAPRSHCCSPKLNDIFLLTKLVKI